VLGTPPDTDVVVTVRVAEPVTPPLVATMLVVPAVRAVMTPAAVTEATDALELDQVTVLPVRAVPFASLGVAVAWPVLPTASDVALSETATEATVVDVVWLEVGDSVHFRVLSEDRQDAR
jgi:hypothetical protein